MAKRVPQVQVNVRLDEDLVRVLEAAAYVERSTVSELVRLALEGVARRWSADPAVRLALKARDQRSDSLTRTLDNAREAGAEADGG